MNPIQALLGSVIAVSKSKILIVLSEHTVSINALTIRLNTP